MIAKVAERGSRTYGLLAYLYGPGRANEHVEPHLVAAWSPFLQEPAASSNPKQGLLALADFLDQPVVALDGKAPAKHVYHVPVRVAPEDRRLTDAEWADVTHRIVAAAGVDGDLSACRWVAVRHADDHIHIVATLARSDGRKPRIHHDVLRMREECRALEKQYGLRTTAPADRTAERLPPRPEQEKALRQGMPRAPRENLREAAYAAAAKTVDVPGFVTALRDAGVIVECRLGSDSQPTGYKVGLPDWRTQDGELIWYTGARLAPDLSLPKLLQRWSTPHTPTPTLSTPALSTLAALYQAATLTTRATQEVRTAACPSAAVSPPTPPAVAAASDLLTATAHALEGRHGGPLTEAAAAYRRAARDPHRRPVRHDHTAGEMRGLARAIARTGRLLSHRDRKAAKRLASELVLLVDAVAGLREAQQIRHQAEAALAAARAMRRQSDTGTGTGTTAAPGPLAPPSAAATTHLHAQPKPSLTSRRPPPPPRPGLPSTPARPPARGSGPTL